MMEGIEIEIIEIGEKEEIEIEGIEIEIMREIDIIGTEGIEIEIEIDIISEIEMIGTIEIDEVEGNLKSKIAIIRMIKVIVIIVMIDRAMMDQNQDQYQVM